MREQSLNRRDWFPVKQELAWLFASLGLQLVLGFWFGHAYDQRIFMATGALVAAHQNPYLPLNLSGLFQNPAFRQFPAIGYPPP